MQTQTVKSQDFEIGQKYARKWWVIDVTDLSLGRVASFISKVLRGKHKACFSEHVDCGDYVIALNASKIKLTGNKLKDKVYYRHTGFIGGIKSEKAELKLANKPEEILYLAVKQMMPRNALNRKSILKLKVFPGEKHTHQANKPEELTVPRIKHY